MTDFERMNERAMEVENRLNDVRAEVECISKSVISLSETLGNATSNLYDLMSMLDELNEREANNGRDCEADN